MQAFNAWQSPNIHAPNWGCGGAPPRRGFNGISSLDVRSMCLILVWKLLGVAWGLMQKQPKVENVDDMLPIRMPRAAGLRVASAGSAKRKQFQDSQEIPGNAFLASISNL